VKPYVAVSDSWQALVLHAPAYTPFQGSLSVFFKFFCTFFRLERLLAAVLIGGLEKQSRKRTCLPDRCFYFFPFCR